MGVVNGTQNQTLKCQLYGNVATYDTATGQCLYCPDITNQTLCESCPNFFFDNTTNKCSWCSRGLTGCEGCRTNRSEICEHGCPHNYVSNNTHCVPRNLLTVNLRLNPANLITGWNSSNQVAMQNSIDAHRTTIESAILRLIGMENDTDLVKAITLAVGSIVADVELYPVTGTDIGYTEQTIESSIQNNQQSTGLTVLSSSFSNSSSTSPLSYADE